LKYFGNDSYSIHCIVCLLAQSNVLENYIQYLDLTLLKPLARLSLMMMGTILIDLLIVDVID